MKKFLGQDGFYDLIKEAKTGTVIDNNYNRSESEYVTTVYQTATHGYKVVENIDLGVYHSVEKVAL